MKRLAAATLLIGLFTGCAPANITAVKWDNAVKGPDVQTRCEEIDMRDATAMNQFFPKYDGWNIIYVSEYTTTNRFGTDAVVCFQRSNTVATK